MTRPHRRLGPGQRRLDEPSDFPVAPNRSTEAVLASTSTVQSNESPALKPSTVTTDPGTVVFNDSEPATARNTFDSNFTGIGDLRATSVIDPYSLGLPVDTSLGLNYKYGAVLRPNNRPMMVTRDNEIERRDQRAVASLAATPDGVQHVKDLEFRVLSSSGRGWYLWVPVILRSLFPKLSAHSSSGDDASGTMVP
jgi:hypothetical protein